MDYGTVEAMIDGVPITVRVAEKTWGDLEIGEIVDADHDTEDSGSDHDIVDSGSDSLTAGVGSNWEELLREETSGESTPDKPEFGRNEGSPELGGKSKREDEGDQASLGTSDPIMADRRGNVPKVFIDDEEHAEFDQIMSSTQRNEVSDRILSPSSGPRPT